MWYKCLELRGFIPPRIYVRVRQIDFAMEPRMAMTLDGIKPICSNSATRLRDPCLLIGRKWPAWGTLACVRPVVPPNGDPIPYIYEGIW